jgi:hypothetical protein
VKLAVSLIAPFIVTLDGFTVPLYDPFPVPVQLLKLYPLFVLALIGTTCPLLYQLLAGLTVPPVPDVIVK